MNYCPKCGFEVKDMKFCPKCGFDVSTVEVKSLGRPEIDEQKKAETTRDICDEGSAGTVDPGDLRMALIGEKVDHYIPIFDDIEKEGGTRWNWCGCLFAPYWFAYRKMFGWSAVALFAPLLIGFMFGIAMASTSTSDLTYDAISRGIGIVLAIVFGVSANSLYKKRIDQLVAKAPKTATECEKYIKSKGGVSVVGVVVTIGVYIVLYALLAIAAA